MTGPTSDELAEVEKYQIAETMQALVLDCAALATQWRSLVADISASAEAGRHIDYRGLRDLLLQAAKDSCDLFHRVAELEAKLEQEGYRSRNSDSADLTLANIEAPQIVEWIESWPSNNSSRRNAARAAIASSASA